MTSYPRTKTELDATGAKASWDDYSAIADVIRGFTSNKKVACGNASGRNPIIIPHGLGSTPTVVLISAYALQPYALGYNKDAANITVYHSAIDTLNVSWLAIL